MTVSHHDSKICNCLRRWQAHHVMLQVLLLSSVSSATPFIGQTLPYKRPLRRKITYHCFAEKLSAVTCIDCLIIRGGSKDNRNWIPNQSSDQWANYRGFDQDSEREYHQYRENPAEVHENYDDFRRPYDDFHENAMNLPSITSLPSSVSAIFKHGDRKIGLALLGIGAAITFLGVTLFFNKALMRLGNLLFIAGVPLTIGPSATVGYFMKPEKMRATSCLVFGIFLVFIGYPTFGIAFEMFGLLNLFGNMFPMLLFFAKQLPVVGTFLQESQNTNHQPKMRETQNRDEFEPNEYYNRQDPYRDSQYRDSQHHRERYSDSGYS